MPLERRIVREVLRAILRRVVSGDCGACVLRDGCVGLCEVRGKMAGGVVAADGEVVVGRNSLGNVLFDVLQIARSDLGRVISRVASTVRSTYHGYEFVQHRVGV